VTVEAVLRDALDTHETAIVLPLSRRMSGTVDTVRSVAERVAPDRLLVLETGSVTVALGLIALRLQAALEGGLTAAGAAARVARLSAAHRAVFTLETLEFLQRGGRIGRAQAVAGSLLRVRPILQILDGEVAPHSRVRGAHRVMPAIEGFVAAESDPGRVLHVAYAHSRRPEVLDELRARGRARPWWARWGPPSARTRVPEPSWWRSSTTGPMGRAAPVRPDSVGRRWI
jgi:DegV family protein with EDD domain